MCIFYVFHGYLTFQNCNGNQFIGLFKKRATEDISTGIWHHIMAEVEEEDGRSPKASLQWLRPHKLTNDTTGQLTYCMLMWRMHTEPPPISKVRHNLVYLQPLVIDFWRSRPSLQPIEINGEEVEVVKMYKYLRMWVDINWTVQPTQHL